MNSFTQKMILPSTLLLFIFSLLGFKNESTLLSNIRELAELEKLSRVVRLQRAKHSRCGRPQHPVLKQLHFHLLPPNRMTL